MNALADVLACLGAVVTGIGVVLLSVAIRRIERRLAKLEARTRSEETRKLWGKLNWEHHDARSLGKGEAMSDLSAKTR
jgi:hypothetical protein